MGEATGIDCRLIIKRDSGDETILRQRKRSVKRPFGNTQVRRRELNFGAAVLNQIEQRLEIRRQCGGELQTLMRGWLSEAKLGRMQKLPTEFCY